MKHLRKFGLFAAMAMALTAMVGVASASATTITPVNTSFTGEGTVLPAKFQVGTSKYVASFSTNKGAGPYVRCAKSSFTGKTAAEMVSTVSVTPSYTECKTNIGGSAVTANVSSPGQWTVTSGTVISTGPIAYNGTVKINEAVKITVPAFPKCLITVGTQTVSGKGINDAGSPPAGTEINGPYSGETTPEIVVSYTSSECPGVETSTSVYRGAVHIPGIYVSE